MRYNLQKYGIIITCLFLLLPCRILALQATPPVSSKYVPGVQSILESHKYLQEHPAPVYWKISPFYMPQRNESSCSLATATMVVNALRSHQSNPALVTQNGLLDKVNDASWKKGVAEGGEGVSLDQLGAFISKSLNAYDIKPFSVQVIHTDNTAKDTAETLHNYLLDSETRGNSFIIVNFDQKFFSTLMKGGHFSPVGAYDAQKKRVLLMDPDREVFEPYWVPEALLLKGMASRDDETRQFRGYLVITFHKTRP